MNINSNVNKLLNIKSELSHLIWVHIHCERKRPLLASLPGGAGVFRHNTVLTQIIILATLPL